jgi:hypothetical protein
VLAGKPDLIKNNDYVDKLYEKIEKEENYQRKTFKIVHITDLHTDFEYFEGTNAMCNEPLCCR